jgi:hypothetical protein
LVVVNWGNIFTNVLVLLGWLVVCKAVALGIFGHLDGVDIWAGTAAAPSPISKPKNGQINTPKYHQKFIHPHINIWQGGEMENIWIIRGNYIAN